MRLQALSTRRLPLLLLYAVLGMAQMDGDQCLLILVCIIETLSTIAMTFDHC